MVLRTFAACLLAGLVLPGSALALPFQQDWSDTGLIVADDDWSAVSGFVGRRGDGLTEETGADPRTLLAEGAATPVDVIANQATPSSLFAGGVAEFELADPAIALQPSGTADVPHVVLSFETTGFDGITVSYRLRDLDGSADNALQPVALQYRIGSSGDYADVPGGFVADATSGPHLSELVTPVTAMLPADAEGRLLVQVRILTANADGSDEWVGVDDVVITGTPRDATAPALELETRKARRLPRALRAGIPARVTVDEPARVRMALVLRPRLAGRVGVRRVVGAETLRAEPGRTRAVVRFRPRPRRKLAGLRRFTVVLRAAASDPTGNSSAVAASVRLRR